ncbi:lytic transglycosylase domain-containing protein [Pedobacter sp. N36a]|nr:lytic transglycosylase domain-containing protein [Pedobacter sp. N36a]
MIKKHIITLTVIMTLLVIAKVFAYNMPQAAESLLKEEKTTKNTDTLVSEIEEPAQTMADLKFAEEGLPLGDAIVERKMEKALAKFSYSHLQTNRLHNKAAEWFPVIEPILAAYGIPEDFKYMPLVESGLKSGVSPKGAAGFWQFMPATARSYGLKVNSKVDERNNLRKSTIAAAKYIKELYGIFDNWALVAAAYNVGDNHMRKQINRQKQDNYFKMKLNSETASYVYKLISMKQIMEFPNQYGYKASRAFLAYHAEKAANEADKAERAE